MDTENINRKDVDAKKVLQKDRNPSVLLRLLDPGHYLRDHKHWISEALEFRVSLMLIIIILLLQ